MNGDARYTLPGVMRFLQAEWQRTERERIQWDLEKAEMRTRIAKLECENRALRRDVHDHEKQVLLLRSRLSTVATNTQTGYNGSQNGSDAGGSGPSDGHIERSLDQAGAGPDDSGHLSQDEDDVENVKRDIARYTSQIRTYLEQSGILPDERPIQPPLTVGTATGSRPNLVATCAQFGTATAISSLPGGNLAVGTDEGDVLVYNLQASDPQFRHHVVDQGGVRTMEYCWTAHELFVAGSGIIHTFKVDGKSCKLEPMRTLPYDEVEDAGGDVSELIAIDVSAQGLVAVASTRGIAMWDTQGIRRPSPSLPGLVPSALVFAESAQDTLLLVGSPDGQVCVLDALSGREARSCIRLGGASVVTPAVTALCAVTTLGNPEPAVAVGLSTGDMVVVGVSKGQVLAEALGAHQGAVQSLAASPKQTCVLSTGADGRVSLWTLPGLIWRGRLLSHDSCGGGARAGLWTADNHVVSAGGDGIARIYDYSSL